jgi:NAD+ diphosphatase
LNKKLIIFNNNKIIFDKDINNFILDYPYLNIDIDNSIYVGIGESEDSIYYAVDATNSNFSINEQGYTSLIEIDIRSILVKSSAEEIALVGRAQHLLDWYKNSQFCGACGAKNLYSNKEGAFCCSCSKNMLYPKISPCVIGIILNGDDILLARNKLFPDGMFSAIAGFVEASETLEQTFEREIYEEVGLRVKNIKYFGSQPWPFPNQLMIAFTCEYESGEINVDGDEIVEASWFNANNMPNIPPTSSISGQLINSYLEGHLKP